MNVIDNCGRAVTPRDLEVGETFRFKEEIFLVGEDDDDIVFINLYTDFVFSETTLPFDMDTPVTKVQATVTIID